jgi:hypothetical protein
MPCTKRNRSASGQAESNGKALQDAPAADVTDGIDARVSDEEDVLESSECENGASGSGGDNDDGDGVKTGILEELNTLRSHSSRYIVRTFQVKTASIQAWFYTDLTEPGSAGGQNSKLEVPENYYQRHCKEGWPEEQKSKYLRAVFAGQSATPLVVNLKHKQARVIDGGHRLNALLQFYRGEVGMSVLSKRILYAQLPAEDRVHFDDQVLQVFEYQDIPLKDEIHIYLDMNAALPFSIGEKLAANREINQVVRSAVWLLQQADCKDLMGRMRAALLPSTRVHRNNDLCAAVFCAYNLHFRRSGAMLVSMQQEFCDRVCKDPSFLVADDHADASAASLHGAALDIAAKARAALHLYAAVSAPVCGSEGVGRPAGPTRTRFRTMLVCMMAATEMPECDAARFRRFLQSTDPAVVALTALAARTHIGPRAAAAVRAEYARLAQAGEI